MIIDVTVPNAAFAELDHSTISRLLSIDAELVMRLCLKMARKGDGSLAKIMLEIWPTGGYMNASSTPLLLDPRVPDALLQSNAGHAPLALAWERASESMMDMKFSTSCDKDRFTKDKNFHF